MRKRYFGERRKKETAICHGCNIPFICLTTRHDREYGWVAKRCPKCGCVHNHSLALEDDV